MTASGASKAMYRKGLNVLAAVLGAKSAKIFDARLRFGRKLDLNYPKTLADKISWIELNTDQTLAARLSDKYAVRDHIAAKGLDEMLIPLVGGPWAEASQIDFSALPSSFVLKATHGCEMNLVCRDKSTFDEGNMRKLATKWLREDYPRACVEPHYKLIPHRLYAEEYIGGLSDVIDYKFHCINGDPAFVLTCSERDGERGLRLNLYDLEWNHIEGLQGSMVNDREIERPELLNEMIDVSRTLAEDFDFVRIDLYETDGRVLFGEMTFTPACGVMDYYTDEFIEQWGAAMRIEKSLEEGRR